METAFVSDWHIENPSVNHLSEARENLANIASFPRYPEPIQTGSR